MSKAAQRLHWLPESIANLMHANGIANPSQLAKRLADEIGIGRSTVYQRFHDDWSGEATAPVIYAMASVFKVPLSSLVREPGMGK